MRPVSGTMPFVPRGHRLYDPRNISEVHRQRGLPVDCHPEVVIELDVRHGDYVPGIVLILTGSAA